MPIQAITQSAIMDNYNYLYSVIRKRDMITSEISFRPMAADDWESVAEVSIYISNNHKGQRKDREDAWDLERYNIAGAEKQSDGNRVSRN